MTSRRSVESSWSFAFFTIVETRTSRVSSGSSSHPPRTAVNPKLCSTTPVGVALLCLIVSLQAAPCFCRASFCSLYVLPPPPGLSIPVPRGRKGKRVKAQSTFDVQKVEWIRKYNPDTLLLDDSYRKHLKHQCNKSENHFHPCLVNYMFPVLKPSPSLWLQSVAEGAYALLPEAGGDR